MPNKLKTPLKEQEFYCVSTRSRVTAHKDNISVRMYKNKKMKNGLSPALYATCESCSSPLIKWIKHSDVDKLLKKYGKY